MSPSPNPRKKGDPMSQSKSAPHAAPAAISAATAAALPQSLTPEQIAAIRQQAIKAGIKLDQPSFQRTPDGGLKIMLTLPQELAEPLATWAESAGDDPFDFIHRQLITAISSFVFAGVIGE